MTSDPRSPEPARPWRGLARAFEWLLSPKVPVEGMPAVGIGSVDAIAPRRTCELHVCPACDADTVNPTFADPIDEMHWDMQLRCGSCGASRRLIVDNATAARYDHDLDGGWRQIAYALDRLEQEQMRDWATTFVRALDGDLIDPADFAHR